ncbi:MAG: ABC transporter ATP-binding protein [Elusimicrobiota bacterium]|jgi:ABC-2 type transport system ATP-binding protein
MLLGIKTVELGKRLGPNQALAGVSLDLEAGRLHGVIGPDGAGKTTLLRTLMGLLRPDSGRLEYSRGGAIVPFAAVRPDMAYMPQQQSLYPDLSVAEHLEFFQHLYRLPDAVFRQRSAELLRATRLERFSDRRAGRLSGGMYKKLGLMCALLQSPQALLLDEPTNGIDPISRRELWDMLYRLVDGGVTVIVSTAYMDEAERCGRVHLLDSGRILASGEPRAVLRQRGAASFEALFMPGGGP